MSRFYISQIAASGDSVKFSTVDFKDGINEHDYVVKSNEVFRGGRKVCTASIGVRLTDTFFEGKEAQYFRKGKSYNWNENSTVQVYDRKLSRKPDNHC